MDKVVKDIAGINRQPHGVSHKGNDPKQAAQHDKDMQRVEQLHRRGEK